ncbi:MAG: ankyrin repeat domain-containing protein [Chitinophagaceae bacterium]|nr:ankyrin repeat domain-containing protein [Chitinophagaceae bacterium]
MGELEELVEAIKRGDLEQVRTILDQQGQLVHGKDSTGATPLHYATMYGHRQVAELLIERGADINSMDGQFGATPSGWAIEYLRERGGFLAIELDDIAHAIWQGDTPWVARWLERFPGLRDACDPDGTPLRQIARAAGHIEIIMLFEMEKKLSKLS